MPHCATRSQAPHRPHRVRSPRRDRTLGIRPGLGRLVHLATGRPAASTAVLEAPRPEAPPPVLPGDLVVRNGPDLRLRPGDRVPLLVALAHLYVFDQEGRRICPAPAEQPGLVE
jgi:multiple sugar transport system ATP-binding protein